MSSSGGFADVERTGKRQRACSTAASDGREGCASEGGTVARAPNRSCSRSASVREIARCEQLTAIAHGALTEAENGLAAWAACEPGQREW